jgi:hypothetical protein
VLFTTIAVGDELVEDYGMAGPKLALSIVWPSKEG